MISTIIEAKTATKIISIFLEAILFIIILRYAIAAQKPKTGQFSAQTRLVLDLFRNNHKKAEQQVPFQ
jgi:hypothetical protein